MIAFTIQILTDPLFSFITLLLGFLIGHRLSIGRDKRQEFNKAAAGFRDAFLPEATFLTHDANIGGLGSYNKLHEILRAGYLRQLKALEVFKPSLSITQRAAIYHAWDKYCHPEAVPQDPDEKRDFRFYDYMTIEESEGTNKAKEIALEKINKILEFAQPK